MCSARTTASIMVGFCFAIPGHQARRPSVPAQPHAGRVAGHPRPRTWGRKLRAGAACGSAAARHQTHRVDLRPDWNLKNAFFNIQRWARWCGAITRISTALRSARCMAASPPIAATPSGGSTPCVWRPCWPARGLDRSPRGASPSRRHRAYSHRGSAARAPDPEGERRDIVRGLRRRNGGDAVRAR